MNIKLLVIDIIFYSFCATILIQLFYYLYFFARLAWYKDKTADDNGSSTYQQNPVSIVICARNEAHNLSKNFLGYLVQSYKATHEVVIVNDNSEDDTRYVIDEFAKQYKNITVIDLVQEAKLIKGKKFPLSIGVKSAKHEIVLLSDADCVPASEHWLNLMQAAHTHNKDIVLGYGPYYKLKGVLNKLIRFETFHTALQYLSYALAGQTYMGVGRNLSYKKDLFIKHKGFSSINQIPSGDDDLFINKIATKTNTAICINPDAFTLSMPKTTFAEWKQQKQRHYTTSKYYKTKHKILLGLYGVSFSFMYPLFIAACLLYSLWWLPLAIFGLRLLIQGIVYYKVMHKLNEQDLFKWYWLLDIWMFIYQIIFFPTLFKKPKNTW